jgi:predicted nucleic acid-binding protein
VAAVLDACAMIAFLRDEPGAHVVEDILLGEPANCYAHAINLCEVFYDFVRAQDENTARRAVHDLLDIGVAPREDMDAALWEEAGLIKARHRVSLADAFGLALARRLDADLVSSDHREFDALAGTADFRIRFIR